MMSCALTVVLQRRIPVFLSHVWGVLLMRLSRSYPEIENLHILEELYQKGQPAMFVANHCSWMDIPFLGATVGWRNYKLVSKKELGIVPILGTSIKIGGHIMVDRTDRRSQLKTLKQGINYLKKVSLLGTDSLVFLLIDTLFVGGCPDSDVVSLNARVGKDFLYCDAHRCAAAPNTHNEGGFEAAVDDLGTQLKRIVQ